MILTDLADACRASGLKVVEVDGWKTRAVTDSSGNRGLSSVESIVCHHTATSLAALGDYPSLRVVRDGRADLRGPLSQLGLGRSGTVYVIAAGLAWHAGETREPWMDNWHAIGIEAEADGTSAWPAEQTAAYARLCAALCAHYGVPVTRVLGHKEVCWPAGRKTDPNFDMPAFREQIKGVDMLTDEDIEKIAKRVCTLLLSEELGNGETVKTNIRRAGDVKDILTERWGL